VNIPHFSTVIFASDVDKLQAIDVDSLQPQRDREVKDDENGSEPEQES
jgi:hypothetical protein